MSWSEFVRTVWPIMASITPLILALGFAWLKNQFPTKIDLKEFKTEIEKDVLEMRLHTVAISDRQIALDHRVKSIEVDLDRAPSKLDLSKDIGKVAERVGRMEAGLETLTRQLGTHNNYLQTLIEKHLK